MATTTDARILAHRMMLATILSELPNRAAITAGLLPPRDPEPTNDEALAAYREEITTIVKLAMAD